MATGLTVPSASRHQKRLTSTGVHVHQATCAPRATALLGCLAGALPLSRLSQQPVMLLHTRLLGYSSTCCTQGQPSTARFRSSLKRDGVHRHWVSCMIIKEPIAHQLAPRQVHNA